MTDWGFTTGNALTRKVWHKDFVVETKQESFFYASGLVSSNPASAIILELPDLENDQGDKITYGQIRDLSGSGVLDDGTMEGNEEAPLTYDDDVTLGMIRNAIRTAGRLNMQRPSDDGYRKWAKELLGRWQAATLDQSIFTSQGTSSTKAIYGGDATSTATIEAGDYMTLYMLASGATYGKKATPLVTGPTFKGRKTNGIAVISPDQAFDLTQRDGAWSDTRMSAMMRGLDNPVFTGALGMQDLIPIHQHIRCPVSTTWGSGSNLNGATGFIFGIGAGVIAYGKREIWNEKTFDYGNKVGFCIGLLWGVSKSVFQNADNATIELRTYRSSN